ncbi:sigma-54-dependent transcriptional regulator [Leptothrix discophora]|uniref:Sigma-54 dependent transcriptional regulator n=1 Tax=Leptothrix discophora TaxID=89 RepID=A0ABT9FZI5_LEPDI|nr:sigma-54 dependent transcriptional regulator [Leptothrix discophora]MDP4299631.1 sigma-54 dependent transcriptional regulator [Leptothrix discophora]
MRKAILLIEDETILAKNMGLYLEHHDCEVRHAETAEEGIALLDRFKPDAVVLDFNLPGMDGLEALRRLQERAPTLPVVMITGHGNVEMAVEAMKLGAVEFLTKPVSLAKLKLVLDRTLEDARRDRALDYLTSRDNDTLPRQGLVGESGAIRQLRATLQQLLEAENQMSQSQQSTPPAVLVLGETGTGKEVVARTLHFSGRRRGKPFVELNCAALPADLLESELFGHERGAFTGANERKLGLVETAEGGTLFLDEIGDMDLSLQAKLLKLLEERTMRRVGGLRELNVDVRVIAATHRPLEALVQEGRFRADLYFRLCVVRLVIAPLREREQDALLLAEHFLAELAGRYGRKAPVLSPGAQRRMLAHGWPGNVRELRNVLEQALLMNSSGQIEEHQLALVTMNPTTSVSSAMPGSTRPAANGNLHAGGFPQNGFPHNGYANSGFGNSGFGGLGPTTGTAGTATPVDPVAAAEREVLVSALERCHWNVSRTAQALNLTRDALRYRLEKHGLQRRMSFEPRGPSELG